MKAHFLYKPKQEIMEPSDNGKVKAVRVDIGPHFEGFDPAVAFAGPGDQ